MGATFLKQRGALQRALAAAGGRAAQVLLTADDVRRRTSYLNARATLEALLAWDVVPIVNENDSTATDEITFGDNDALAAQVALLLRARLLVLLTDAEGLFTRDPRSKGAELVREVEDRALLADLDLGAGSSSGLGSGGMRSKVVAASMAAVASAWHFDPSDDGGWRAPKTGEELRPTLARLLQERIGLAVAL